MMLVWAGTIAGVVLIFLDIGGWPYSLMFIMTNPHPVLGLAALALTFIQPFIALCRPHQTSPLRWIFNWCHWFVGNCAQVFCIYLFISSPRIFYHDLIRSLPFSLYFSPSSWRWLAWRGW